MEISKILSLQGILFLLMVIGIIVKKKGILTEEGRAVLTDLLIYVFLPAMITNSFRVKFNYEILIKFIVIIVFAFAAQFISMFLAGILYKNQPEGRRKVLKYATVSSNAGFMGLAVVEGVYESAGLMYGSVCLIPQRIVMWSAGISCFTASGSKKDIFKRVALHPCIIAVYIGLILMFFQINLPIFLDKTLKSVGGCTTAVSMILIGSILGEIEDIKSVVSKTVLYYSFIRLILIPFIVFSLCRICGVNPLSTGIEVLISGMPAASTSAILAAKYNGDYIFAGKCIVCSTVLSIITIPLWCMVL